MRLVRFPGRPARVSDDIRAALASLGAGEAVVGGVALLGVRPPGVDSDIDAVLVLPRGVFVVVGVDLPDPAMTLAAPLRGAWTTDGWPLVRPDDSAVNPAVDALALAGTVADRVHAIDTTVGLATIIAVGPFVQTVEQPPDDLAVPVRVIHPSASAVLAATEALPAPTRALTTDQARALLHGLAPSSAETGDLGDLRDPGDPGDLTDLGDLPDLGDLGDLGDDVLAAEGFTPANGRSPTASPPGTAPPPHSPALEVAGRQSPAAPPPVITPRAAAPRTRPRPRTPWKATLPHRRHVLAATGLLLLVAAATVAIVAASGRDAPAPASGTATNTPVVVAADGLEFTTVATDDGGSCAAPAAVGDIEVFLAEHGCASIRRGSYTTTVGDRRVAVSVAAVTFADDVGARRFHTLVRTPGSGVVTDVATESGRWPGGAPDFAHATHAAARRDRTVWFVLADTPGGSSPTADSAQTRAAEAALTMPLGR